jgi:hypothetical protein
MTLRLLLMVSTQSMDLADCIGEDEWQARLPLKPTGPWIDGRPPNACFRAGEFYKLGNRYNSSKGEFEVLNMAVIPTSPGHCRLV